MNDYFGRPAQQFNPMYNTAYNCNFQPQMAQQTQNAPMRTNKIYVTSLEDALNRYAEPNTIMVYRHQDERFEYEITTDNQGKKTYKTLQLGDYSTVQSEKQVVPNGISTEEFNALKNRIKALEDEVLNKYKETIRNEKNGGLK